MASKIKGERMKSIVEHLGLYAAYHRDRRNILTHFIGVPLIVLAVVVLLSRPFFSSEFLTFSPAWVAAIVSTAYYLRLDTRMGMVMGCCFAVMIGIGTFIAALTTMTWLVSGLGLFLVGWIIQFVGHYFEGRKPAFMDDIMGLMIGPLFVAAELAFLLGLRQDLATGIEEWLAHHPEA
jgi:uncharacterized membrane protein YGL010W